MKLLIATGLYAPEIGGPATYTAFLEKHLVRITELPMKCFPIAWYEGTQKLFAMSHTLSSLCFVRAESQRSTHSIR
jgi:hypothetical protein